MVLPFDQKEFETFKSTLAKRESGGDPSIVNKLGYVGLYQFGAQALESVGLLKKGASKKGNSAINDPNNWTVSGGVEEFKRNIDLQDQALMKLMEQNYNVLSKKGVISDNMDKADIAGYLAASHLGGAGNAIKLAKGQDFKDAFGTSIKEYYNLGKESLGVEVQDTKPLETPKEVKPSTESKGEIYSVPDNSGDIFQQIQIDREKEVRPDVSSLEGFSAGFTRENPLATVDDYALKYLISTGEIDPNYNPFEDIQGYEAFANHFKDIPNKAAAEVYKQHLDEIVARNDTIARGGIASLVGSLAGGILSPTTLIPGIGLMGKGSVLTKALTGAATTATAVGLDELALSPVDETRTTDESLSNILAGAALGGVLGGVIGKMQLSDVAKAELMDEVAGATKKFKTLEKARESTAGARQVVKELPGDNDLVIDSLKFEAGVNTLKKTNPLLRTLTSRSDEAKALVNKLTEHDFILKKHLRGVAGEVPVESHIKAKTGKIYPIIDELDRLEGSYKSSTGKSTEMFQDEIMSYIRDKSQPASKEAKMAAERLESYFKKLHKEYVESGVYKDEMANWTKAKQTFVRAIDPEKIAQGRIKFQNAIEKIVKRQLKDELLDDIAISDITDEVVSRLSKGKVGELDNYIIKNKEGQGLVLKLDDPSLREFYFNDINKLLLRHTKENAIKTTYKDIFGDTSINKQLEKVREEYDKLIEKNPDLRGELSKEADSVVRDLKAVDERIRGVYKLPENPYDGLNILGKSLLAASYVTKLGGVAISQLADYGRLLFSVKLTKAIGHDVEKLGTVLKGAKLTKHEMKLLEIGTDSYINVRALEMAEMGDLLDATSKFSRHTQALVNGFTKATGMTYMNDFNKRMAAIYFADEALKDFQLWKVGKLSKEKELFYLKRNLSKQDAIDTLREFRKHGSFKDGVRIANLHRWGPAGDKFKAALKREVDSIIITPSAGDRPLWMSSGMGKVLGQFKSFSFTATNKILLPALQRTDVAALERIISQVALGSVVYILKAKLAGYDPDLDPRKLILEGIDRSGVTGILYDINNIVERSTGLGINSALGVGRSSKASYRSFVSTLAGPAVGVLDNVQKAVGAMAKKFNGDNLTAGDVNNLKRLVPGNNLFYLRWLFDSGFEKLSGIKQRKKQGKY